MQLLLTFVRWALALALGFIAFTALQAGDTLPALVMFLGALVVLPPIALLLGRLAAPLARPAVAIGLAFALVLAGLALAGLGLEGGHAPHEASGDEQPVG